MSYTDVRSFSIAGFQHHRVACSPRGGGVSILIREDLPVEVGRAVIARTEHVHVTLHMTEWVALTLTSAYFTPGRGFTSAELDELGINDGGSHIIGADANAHALARDCAILEDSRGMTLVQWCLDNEYNIANTGESTCFTLRHGPSAPDVTLYHGCEVYNWASQYSACSDHFTILFDVVIG